MRRTTVGSSIRMEQGPARLAVALLALAGLSGMLAGCGAGSEFLPSNLPGAGGGVFLITTTTLEDGVINRSYSKAIDTVGGTPPVTSCSIVAGALPAGLGVAPMGAQCILSGTPTASGTFFFTLRADDSSFPFRTDNQDFTLVIRQEYSITTPAPDPLPTGVEDRAYNFAFTVMTNTVQGPDDVGEAAEFGNGPLTACSVTAGLPTGMTQMTSNLTANSCTITLGGTPNIGLVAGSMPMAFALTVSVTDTSIGGSNVPARTISQTAVDLVINPPLAFTLTTGGTFDDATSGGNAPDAVTGRTYGAPNRLDLVFTASGGIAPYTWMGPGGAPPTPFGCVQSGVNGEIFSCNSGNMPITTPGNTATNFTVQVQDTANAAVAQGTQGTDVIGHASHTINVVSEMNIQVFPTGTTASDAPDGVTGRGYGTPAGGSDLAFTTIGGLAPIMMQPDENTVAGSSSAAGFPADLLCASTMSGETTCTTGASTIMDPAGNYALSLSATDTANDTTPSSVRMQNFNLTINDEIAIDNLFLPNGVVGQPYSVMLTCNQTTGNMLCGGTGNPNNAAATYMWSEVSGPANTEIIVSTSVASNPSTGLYSDGGTPPATTGTFTPTITVTDNGNPTTPACSAVLPTPTCPTFTATYDVIASMVLVDASNEEIDLFTTDTGTLVAAGNITLGMGATPRRVAVTPNARIAVVADPGRSEVSLIDLVNNGVTTVTTTQVNGPLTSGAGDPTNVAIGPATSPTDPLWNPDSFVAYVTNPTAGTVDVVDIDPNSASFGEVIASPAIAGAKDVAVTPTIDPGMGPETRVYVLSGNDEVCAIDAEPSSGSFLTQIDIFTGVGNCIDTSAVSGDTTFIEISSDGATALVVKTDGGGEPAGTANVISLPVSPTSTFRDTGANSSSDVTSGGQQCFRPNDLRSRPGIGQREDVYLACGTDTTTGDKILLLGPSPFGLNDPSATFSFSGQIPLTTGDDPQDIAFDPQGELGIVTVPGNGNNITPLTNGASTPPAPPNQYVALPNVTGPEGVAHVPNPGNLRLVGGPDSNAQAGNQFYGSFRYLGGVRPFTWVEPTGTFFDANGMGLGNCAGLRIDYATGIIIGTPTATPPVTCGPFSIRVTDSTPGSPQSITSSGFIININ